MKARTYLILLLVISFSFFHLMASWFYSSQPYTDFLLTMAVVHFVLSKLISVEPFADLKKEK